MQPAPFLCSRLIIWAGGSLLGQGRLYGQSRVMADEDARVHAAPGKAAGGQAALKPLLLSLLACLFFLAAPGAGAAPAACSIRPAGLRCEESASPLGIDAPRPRLSWLLAAVPASERGQRQTGYQVRAASTPARLRAEQPDLWDSGRVASGQQLHVAYAGRALRSGQRVWWSVRVWDRQGRPSDWSPAAWWEMGLLRETDWGARWVAAPHPRPQRGAGGEEASNPYAEHPNPLFRREFTLKKPLASARAYVCGLGYYELRLNGAKVGDHVLDPGWTDYSRRALYATYDVTPLLKPGPNAVGIMLGNGWYNPLPLPLFGRFNLRKVLPVGEPRAILRLEVRYADGSREVVVTDERWEVGDGPILRNSVYLGELYDARREQRGWDQPGFDDRTWRPAAPAAEAVGPLRAQTAPPIRVRHTFPAVRVTEPTPGTFIVDMGRNFAGWVTLRARGPAGTRVTLRYGELLNPDGTLNPMTSVTGQLKRARPNMLPGEPPIAWQSDAYVLKGEGEEVYTPRFTFHGFRYVELTGFPGRPTVETLQGHLLSADVLAVGSFSCSNPLFNQVQEMTRWTLLSNLFSVQSDCPHREKLGYGGDIVATDEMAILNFDMGRFYAKAVEDFADAQRPNGGFTETAPYVGIADESLGESAGPVGWGTAHPLLLWHLYQYYGDRQLLARQYPNAQRWLALLEARAVDGILDNGISDHESLVRKPRALTGTAFFYLNARLLGRFARILGRGADARRYEALAGRIRQAFDRRFRQPGGRYDSGTQACQAFALFFGLTPPAEKPAALDVLVKDVVDLNQGHLTTGIFGTKYMLLALSDMGRPEVAYTVANQRTFPGWGYMVENGATTLWEHWAFSDNTYSHNHPMFGSVSEWFIKALAGIQPDPEAVGFDRIVIRPHPVGDLRWAGARHRTARGLVTSAWRRAGGTLFLTVTVPANTTATVFVPTRDARSAREGGVPAGRAKGVRFLGTKEGSAVYQVGSGRYSFAAKLN